MTEPTIDDIEAEWRDQVERVRADIVQSQIGAVLMGVASYICHVSAYTFTHDAALGLEGLRQMIQRRTREKPLPPRAIHAVLAAERAHIDQGEANRIAYALVRAYNGIIAPAARTASRSDAAMLCRLAIEVPLGWFSGAVGLGLLDQAAEVMRQNSTRPPAILTLH